jgi:BirA family transcriptional regulator, biotin operon repressor / biotin---[acetyl-CoA-carboxylase] ligase
VISHTALNAAVSDTIFAGKLNHFPIIDSTNSHALREAAAGAATGSVYFADEQTAGRGRGAHTWHSEPGSGLYVSLLLRPKLAPSQALWLSFAAGLAVHAAIREVAGVTPDIRWPNDLLLAEAGFSKKFCGILTEMHNDGDRVRHAVTGIGINVNHAGFPAEIAPLATSLRLVTGDPQDREQLLAALLRAMDAEIRALEEADADDATLLTRVEKASSWIRGKRVHVDEAGGYDGVTAGLDARGFLLVDTDAGRHTVLSGGVREAKE